MTNAQPTTEAGEKPVTPRWALLQSEHYNLVLGR